MVTIDSPGRPVIVAATTTIAAGAPSCTVNDSAPRISKLVPPQYTDAMQKRNKGGIVDVTVYLGADGSVVKAVVTHSADDALLDAATYAAAVASTYSPEVRGCKYLAGSYIFRARYSVSPTPAAGGPTAMPAEGPPAFPPQLAPTPAPLVLPSDRDDVITTYSPGALGATPAPAARSASGTAVTPVKPFRPIPIPGPTGGHTVAPLALPTPAPSPSPAP